MNQVEVNIRDHVHGADGVSAPFVSGTRMLFQQTAAPTGWTKDMTHNNKALRLQTGTVATGGATAFTTVFGSGKTSGAHTLSTDEIPAHTHELQQGSSIGSGNTPASGESTGLISQSRGGGSSHTHTLPIDLQFVDVIIATVD